MVFASETGSVCEKAIPVKVRGLYTLERESQKELILKINVYCIMLLSPVRGKRRYFGCVGSGLKYIRYSPNVFIYKLTELVNSASLFKIH